VLDPAIFINNDERTCKVDIRARSSDVKRSKLGGGVAEAMLEVAI
jgi:hypothetical protein